MGRKVPEPVEHMVAALVRKGYDKKRAYAIAVGRLQQLGYLKKGTLKLTEEGKRKLAEHYKEPLRVRARKIALATKLTPEGALAKLVRTRKRRQRGGS